jgi:hypothetical protein
MGKRRKDDGPKDVKEVLELKKETDDLAGEAMADNTTKQYRYKGAAFVRFALRCFRALGLQGDPTSLLFSTPAVLKVLPLYVAHLAKTCTFTSAKAHMSAIRHLYISRGLENPIPLSHKVRLCLRGLRRRKGDGAPNRKLGITIGLLRLMAEKTNREDPEEVAFMTAALVAFFTCARKANVTVENGKSWDPEKGLRRRDVKLLPEAHSLLVTFRHTKTIQFKERILEIPICGVKGSILDPVWWWCRHLCLSGSSVGRDDQAFSFKPHVGKGHMFMTHKRFVERLKLMLRKVGTDPSSFSGHSFRRGGATFLFKACGNSRMVQAMGDWKSNAFSIYVSVDLADRWKGALSMKNSMERDTSKLART